MRPALTVIALFVTCPLLFSQDLKLREEAERLLERANAVSTSPKLPNLERVDTFRVFSDSGVQEGSFSRVVIQGVGRRDECSLGDYQLINVWGQKQVAVSGRSISKALPPDLLNVFRITPIHLVRFDSQDVIRSINDRNIRGRDAHCIQFDTIHGERSDPNEICTDASNGTLLLEKLDRETVENSDFFSFAGALMPGKISYSFAGVPKLEITQTMTALGASDTNVLTPPPDAKMHRICTTYRRPFGLSMPQPKPGNGGSTADVVIRSPVAVDGHLYEPVVQASDRPDLNSEALDLARQWTFTPAMCDGKADVHEVDFVLHFIGR